VHPTAEGHVLIADGVEAALRTAGWPERPLHVRAPAPITPPPDPFADQGDKYFQGIAGPLRKPGDPGRPPGGPHR
jgi:hypothetical protein